MSYNIFIFRRDYRLIDNIGLHNTLNKYNNVICIFIGTPEQLDSIENEYKSDNSVQFIYESLIDLNNELNKYKSQLYMFYGNNISILTDLIKLYNINSINYNIDYTPYAINRDKEISDLCKKNSIECNEYEDYLLIDMSKILTNSGTVYKVYGQFQKKEINYNINKPINKSNFKNLVSNNKIIKNTNYVNIKYLLNFFINNDFINTHGGRKNALKIINNIKQFNSYSSHRDTLTYNTTHLSAYIKFGCVSIREIYWAFKEKLANNSQTLINQLIWRDFYYNILFHMPNNLNNSMREKFNKFKWINNKEWFKAWCEGKTGFPIVDACMRQLNKTGYMHNRGRLITSNFLTRILICNWKWGEKYYATKLVDYDVAVNNGNWQWSAGTGTDTAPFSQRIFNPWLQSEKFDMNCGYIKQWIPELIDVDNKHIHRWDKYYSQYDLKNVNYFEPIVDYKLQRDEVKKIHELLT
jgi:deoxyribodipyrimidine photo-lyase